ncbi:MAG: ABC transporter substrate-binding protein [Butyricicoccus sp.]|nr:ABC transporter substrate-binding protein [Butyricicoccus sp.]
MKKLFTLLLAAAIALSLAACGSSAPEAADSSPARGGSTLIYGSGSFTRINPAMDEHGEINLLLFNGLTAHDGGNNVVPCLAESWEFDRDSCTYTFHLAGGVRWHDGESFTAEDVKFTVEAIMDPDNASENAPNFEDVEEITAPDERTVSFRLSAPNAAFLDYMTMPVLPEHLLAGEDMQTSDFFRAPVGTGPYRLAEWDEGQAVTLVRNEDYFKGAVNIETIIFKFVPDDSARTLQLRAGELDLAQLTPRDAQTFAGDESFAVYRMTTSDYRGIMFNFNNPYWDENREMIPAICCAIDRQAIVDSVLLGCGESAYGPLQRNVYDNPDAERWDYDPGRAETILLDSGYEKRSDGFYYRGDQKAAFVLNAPSGDRVRLEIAQAAAQQLRAVGIDCSVEIPTVVDWGGQMAYLIGWGSPFDADDHTYKVFGSGKGANYSGYSNATVDRYLTLARETDDEALRAEYYDAFQLELSRDPAFAFICYVDADYVAAAGLEGISADTVMGHHGVGIFWNIAEWTITK